VSGHRILDAKMPDKAENKKTGRRWRLAAVRNKARAKTVQQPQLDLKPLAAAEVGSASREP